MTGNELRDVDRELSHLMACAQRVRNGLAAMHAEEAGRATSIARTALHSEATA